jgi:riboflavin kinase, archaea type
MGNAIEKNLYVLLYLAEKTKLYNRFCGTTIKIAKDLDLSQQSVSRKLILLEQEGYIKRLISISGVDIQLTKKAITHLKEKYKMLKFLFGKQISLKGTVEDGLGEGKFYMSVANYKRQFKQHFGFKPFEGTLNLRVDSSKVQQFVEQYKDKEVLIKGFKTPERTYGDVRAYPVSLCDKVCTVLILPDRTLHANDVVEVVSDVHLRTKLEVGTGDQLVLR